MMTRAYVLINSRSTDTDEHAKKFKKIGGVIDAYAVYGNHDIILEVEAKNLRKLRDKIIEIRELEDTGETKTLIEMEKEDDLTEGD
ncbi:MAG: Lrp/AsnC ligand binding domain-containing protein [Theionarchaea archaeon]|nr:Lrp/AsnC ligand binding domain-containing protein [Theionarchaea archaeon]